ncbi:MAG: restriction endonuclease [Acidobacteria bacterium]|nr:restriction endonuclease [Acidobacteriota bacterium]MBI3425298.1 restriction endonuclease [Acidobacteriota bacterium]
MNESEKIETSLGQILSQYQDSFSRKTYQEENNEVDLLMAAFAITPELKRENRQYWGRELGMCWQRLVIELCRQTCPGFKPALRIGADEPCDFIVDRQAIDTKYRIGSGDSGTLKKFKGYGKLLTEQNYQPILLIVREDNLGNAINACLLSGWQVLTGNATYNFIQQLTGFDLKQFLQAKAAAYKVSR